VLIDASGTSTGSLTVRLYDVVDAAATGTINGVAVPVSVTKPTQVARVTFDGLAGQQVTVRITGNSMGYTAVSLRKADGSHLTSSSTSAAAFNLATHTLPANGNYTVLVDPSSTNIGSMNVSVTNP
jgi:hypothetical protein